MKFILRCGFCWVLPGIVAMGSAVMVAQTAAVPSALAHSAGFDVERMSARKMANGTESKDVVRGVLATGEAVGVHESVQPVGTVPVALHTIGHSEFVVVVEGMVEFDHDGKTERVGPGGVIYVAFGTEHRLKNVGDTPAKYVVVAVGGDVRK